MLIFFRFVCFNQKFIIYKTFLKNISFFLVPHYIPLFSRLFFIIFNCNFGVMYVPYLMVTVFSFTSAKCLTSLLMELFHNIFVFYGMVFWILDRKKKNEVGAICFEVRIPWKKLTNHYEIIPLKTIKVLLTIAAFEKT